MIFLDMALMFRKRKDEAKQVSITAFYALNPDGPSIAQMSNTHAKHVLSSTPLIVLLCQVHLSDFLFYFRAFRYPSWYSFHGIPGWR